MGGTCKPCGCGEDKTTFNSYDRGKTIIDISQSKADALKFLKTNLIIKIMMIITSKQ